MAGIDLLTGMTIPFDASCWDLHILFQGLLHAYYENSVGLYAVLPEDRAKVTDLPQFIDSLGNGTSSGFQEAKTIHGRPNIYHLPKKVIIAALAITRAYDMDAGSEIAGWLLELDQDIMCKILVELTETNSTMDEVWQYILGIRICKREYRYECRCSAYSYSYTRYTSLINARERLYCPHHAGISADFRDSWRRKCRM